MPSMLLELGEKWPHLFHECFLFFYQKCAYLFILPVRGLQLTASQSLTTFETSISARVYSPPTVLIHLYLHSIIHVSHFTIVRQFLSEYYFNAN